MAFIPELCEVDINLCIFIHFNLEHFFYISISVRNWVKSDHSLNRFEEYGGNSWQGDTQQTQMHYDL